MDLTRLIPWRKKSIEGEYRPGPYYLNDGVLSHYAGQFMNWWQMGYSLNPYCETGAMVEACISAYSQTVAMCPGDHWRRRDDGGRDRVSFSALSRLMKHPNDYQSISDFMLNLTRNLYAKGEAFAVGIRNARNEIGELHLMRDGQPNIAVDGSIFYSLSGNEVIDNRFDFSLPIPARDVLHVRLHTPKHVLKGVSPILATVLDRMLGGAALNQQITYYLNQARPSFILETDLLLNETQMKLARESWDAQTTGINQGKTPIMAWGIKARPITGNAKDAELAELLKMNDQNIALAFRLPLQVLGIGGQPFGSTELLMQAWISSGLGFALNHIEEAFGVLFGLKGVPNEYLEFDTRALLRSAFRERIEGLARGVMGGIFSSDEARADFDLPETPGGHGAMPRVQQQVVPLSYGTEMKPPQPTPPKPPSEDGKESDSEESDTPNDEAARSLEYYSNQINAHAAEFRNLH